MPRHKHHFGCFLWLLLMLLLLLLMHHNGGAQVFNAITGFNE